MSELLYTVIEFLRSDASWYLAVSFIVAIHFVVLADAVVEASKP